MIEIGRVCMKIAGRDAGKLGVIVEIIDDVFVVLDGEVRRRKVNIKHLEPINKKVEINEKSSHSDVLNALGLKEEKKKTKERKTEKGPRPKKVKKKREKPEAKKKKVVKKEKKKEVKKEENVGSNK